MFAKHDVFNLVLENYFLYHIESPDSMVADIDHFIETGRVIEA